MTRVLRIHHGREGLQIFLSLLTPFTGCQQHFQYRAKYLLKTALDDIMFKKCRQLSDYIYIDCPTISNKNTAEKDWKIPPVEGLHYEVFFC